MVIHNPLSRELGCYTFLSFLKSHSIIIKGMAKFISMRSRGVPRGVQNSSFSALVCVPARLCLFWLLSLITLFVCLGQNALNLRVWTCSGFRIQKVIQHQKPFYLNCYEQMPSNVCESFLNCTFPLRDRYVCLWKRKKKSLQFKNISLYTNVFPL